MWGVQSPHLPLPVSSFPSHSSGLSILIIPFYWTCLQPNCQRRQCRRVLPATAPRLRQRICRPAYRSALSCAGLSEQHWKQITLYSDARGYCAQRLQPKILEAARHAKCRCHRSGGHLLVALDEYAAKAGKTPPWPLRRYER